MARRDINWLFTRTVIRPRDSVVCDAVNSAKFTHTVDASKSDETRLVEDFALYFPGNPSVVTRENVLALVSLNMEVREWYKRWSNIEGRSRVLPGWLDPKKNSDVDAYAKLQDEQAAKAQKESEWNERITKAASLMKRTVETVDSEKKAYYQGLSKLMQISMTTLIHLPLKDQIEITQAADDVSRKNLESLKLEELRKELKRALDAGTFKSPFA